MTSILRVAILGVLILAGGTASAEAPPQVRSGDPASTFETSIAPLLAKHCLECHTAHDAKGGLDLTRKQTAFANGANGTPIVPGRPGESLAWQYVDADEMPQNRPPLSADEKQLLRDWIARGADWTLDPLDPLAYSSERRAGYDWWSLQPPQSPAIPAVRDRQWIRNEIDAFVLAKLEARNLRPAPEADRRILIRRLTFDLTGLPPKPEAVERFLHDESADAYERLVEELLASPHYGERWARHWLDVVRFGESQGFERNRIRENAWRYRDWVVAAFNHDLPYDDFLRLQIAGDLLVPGDYDAAMATGYHVCGTWDQVGHLEGSQTMQLAARQDHLEDLVGTLGQAFLGLTINCARCHDHKFDPISQADYYRIAALLDGVTQQEKERADLQLVSDSRRAGELRAELASLQTARERLETEIRAAAGSGRETKSVAGLQLLYLIPDKPGDTLEDSSRTGSPLPLVKSKTPKSPRWASGENAGGIVDAVRKSNGFTLELWITPAKAQQSGPARIATLSKDSGTRNVTLGHDGDRLDLRFRTTKTDNNGLPSLLTPAGSVSARKMHVVAVFDAGRRTRLFVDGKLSAEKELGGELSNWDPSLRFGLGDEFTGDRAWAGEYHFVALYDRALSEDEIRQHFDTESRDVRTGESFAALLEQAPAELRNRYADLRQQIDAAQTMFDRVVYAGPAHVVAPRKPGVTRVLQRGDIRTPLDVVAPAGLSALEHAGLPADFGLKPDAADADRRIKLAEWIADSRNPLTARVFVNRLWHYHFGRGIVDTPSDFGFSGGRPSHPELLDFLAVRFAENGWKIKDLHRLIVTSATYRQESRAANADAEAVDGDNRLLWRFHPRHLEGEAVRDAILEASGALNPQVGGPSFRDVAVKLNTNHEFTDPTNEFSDETRRRTIYRLWARSGNHAMLQSLDCPDPSVMVPLRPGTITPLQALSLLNNPFVEQCADRFAARVRSETPGDDARAHADRAYRLAFGRPASERELSIAKDFIDRHGLAQFCLALFNANEFLFVN